MAVNSGPEGKHPGQHIVAVARSAASRAARALGRDKGRRLQDKAADRLVAELTTLRGLVPRTAVVGLVAADAALETAARRLFPAAHLVAVGVDGSVERAHAFAAAPYDVIIDNSAPSARRRTFEHLFFLTRPGAPYVVLAAAAGVSQGTAGLGALLAEGARGNEAPLRKCSRTADSEETRRTAIRHHVQVKTMGRHVHLSHDLPDVLLKLRDEHSNEFWQIVGGVHRVLATIPAEEPPARPPGVEGPVPRTPRMHRPIMPADLHLREYRDVEVAPHQVVRSGAVALPDTFRHGHGAAIRSQQLIDVTPFFAVPRKEARATRELKGTWLHLDNEVRGHFGHVLTESVSRFWTWKEALRRDPDVRVLVGATRLRPKLLPYEIEIYEAGGIPRDRILVIDEPVRVEKLISGSPMFAHPHFVHPRIVETWDEVGDRLAAKVDAKEWPLRIFIGRRGSRRSCHNAEELEGLFAEFGFQVVYPEDHPLGDQVNLFRSAEVIAGYAGSGLFQAMFVPKPTRIIQVAPSSYRPRNEYLIASIRGHHIDSVVSAAEGTSLKESFEFDMENEGAFLRRLLEELPPQPLRS